MTRYVAFLRGINLGNRRITGDELRARFEALEGLSDVATFLASGNVIFDAEAGPGELEAAIERHLRETLDYEVDTFVRPLEHLEGLAGPDLFSEAGTPGYKVHVLFLKEAADERAGDRLREIADEEDRFRTSGRELYWLRHGGLGDSKLQPADLERAAGAETSTLRTLNTVQRIVAKFSVDDG